MDATTLNCLMCGAPARSDAPNCSHCGARLATVACPHCFGMIFQGSKFCPRCGTTVHLSTGEKTQLPCPRCKKKHLEYKEIGTAEVHECGGCHGLWVEVATFERICTDREKQSVVLGTASETFVPGRHQGSMEVRYVPCPVCKTLMHRRNFAKCSGVIVDVCRAHGTWFDRDELHHIVQFIHSGGMDMARAREKADLEAARRRLENARRDYTPSTGSYGGGGYSSSYGGGFDVYETDLVTVAGSLLSSFFD